MSAAATAPRLAPARAATRTGAVGWLGVVLAVLAVLLGLALLREALVAAGLLDGGSWLAPAVDAVDGTGPSVALAAAGVVAALLGLWLVAVAFGRRVRTRLSVRSTSDAATSPSGGVTVGLRDVARLASSAAEEVDGVASARSTATRRKVTVTVSTLEGEDVAPAVRAAVAERLEPLAAPLAVTVVSRSRRALTAGGRWS